VIKIKAESKTKFPCGVEIEVKAKSIFLSFEHKLENNSCPLHGKDCLYYMKKAEKVK